MARTRFRLAAGLLLASTWSAAGADAPAATTNRFEAEVRAIADRNMSHPPPAGAIVFAGSSSIRMWKTLSADFPGRPVVNNGFGGAKISDLLWAFDRVIAPSKPPVLVVYCGENDVAAGRDALATADDYLILFRRCREVRPDMKIAVIPMKPSPKRWAIWPALQAGNARIAQHCRDAGVDLIDVVPEMLGADGTPRPELFVADKLHMSADGYRIWTRLVTRWLDGTAVRAGAAR